VDKRTSLLELLAEVEPKVAEQNDRLTAQYVAISRLAERGQVLSQIKELRNALEHYRDQIKEELDGR
jgi:predicted nuclease with TOPRIM domain